MRVAFPRGQTKTGAAGFTENFPVNKAALRDAILRQLRAELANQTNAAALARDEAISEESRPENKWDTHSQEAAYLAEGQARLAAEIGGNIDLFATMSVADVAPGEAIATGALVELASGALYFLAPRGGGIEVEVDGRTVLVLTPQAPLGRQLLGKRAGDSVTVPGRGARGATTIVSVT